MIVQRFLAIAWCGTYRWSRCATGRLSLRMGCRVWGGAAGNCRAIRHRVGDASGTDGDRQKRSRNIVEMAITLAATLAAMLWICPLPPEIIV